MTCKECSAKEDCCFYRKEEENFPCVYETFKKIEKERTLRNEPQNKEN